MKPYKKKWNPKYRQAITVDWHKAANEFETIMNSKKFLNYSFDHRLNITNLYLQTKDFERSDNIEGYFDLLDQNRKLIKGD
jgi:hypothetical protein